MLQGYTQSNILHMFALLSGTQSAGKGNCDAIAESHDCGFN